MEVDEPPFLPCFSPVFQKGRKQDDKINMEHPVSLESCSYAPAWLREAPRAPVPQAAPHSLQCLVREGGTIHAEKKRKEECENFTKRVVTGRKE